MSNYVAKTLGLKPGAVVFTEFGKKKVDSDSESDSSLQDSFVPNHVGFYTGLDTRCIAHSVKSGGTLPGVKSTEIPNGKHEFFHFKDDTLSARFAFIASSWSKATKVYNRQYFKNLYPSRYFYEPELYKRYLSLFDGGQTQRGPATPYNYVLSETELYDRARDRDLRNLDLTAFRRSLQYAALSQQQRSIGENMRCSSFATAVVQSAVLNPFVKVLRRKCEFFDEMDYENFIKSSIKRPYLHLFSAQEQIPTFFKWPEGFGYNSKYVVPLDIYEKVKNSQEWKSQGTIVVKDSHLIEINGATVKTPLRVAKDDSQSSMRQLNRRCDAEEQRRSDSKSMTEFATYSTPPGSPERSTTEAALKNFTPSRAVPAQLKRRQEGIRRRLKALSLEN